MAAAGNIGENTALFEAVHGSAPDIAGQQVANPSALILAACMMLEHTGERERAKRVRDALAHTLREGTHTTRDVGGNGSTREFADAVSNRVN